MLLLCGLLLGIATAALMARLVIKPPRMNDGKALYLLNRLSPEDLGLAYESLDFGVRDEKGQGLKIAAWWIGQAAAQGRCAVLIHGYSDAKVGTIAWAPLFHELGWNILAVDLRAHGESGGKYTTGGYFERHDLDQVLNQLKALKPEDTRQMVLFGASLGSAVAAATALLRSDIAAVVMDCPYADYRRAAQTHGKLLGVPGGWIARLALWFAERSTGAHYDEVRPVEMVERLGCPLLIIRGEQDFLVDESDAAELEAAARRRDRVLGTTRYWTVPGAGHVLGLETDPEGYRKTLEEVLAAAMQDASGRARLESPLKPQS